MTVVEEEELAMMVELREIDYEMRVKMMRFETVKRV